jgi:amidase
LAKANLSEWANFRSRYSSSGWSGRGGQCRNPYALDRNPCGSSSGSGVAASANLAAGAIGTETNGSIVCPSNANGIVGIKPTVGLVSRSGIIPISHTQDTAGPMTRTVSDGVHILSALSGPDPKDPATKPAAEKAQADYSRYLTTDGIKEIRAGICRQFFGFNADVDKLMEAAIQEIEKLGVTLVDEVEIPNRRQIGGSSYEVMLYEFKADLNSYLQSLGPEAPVKSLEEIIQFNESHPELEMPYFGQDILVRAQEKGPLTDSEYVEALEKSQELSRAKGLDAAMDKDELDVLIAPTGGPAWPTDLVNGDAYGGGSSGPAAIAGYPNITVPMGNIHGLPVGVSFFGRAWSEPTLIRMAFAFEQATKARIKPQFLPTLKI